MERQFKSVLDDGRIEFGLKEANTNEWVKRYQEAPPIVPLDRVSGGHGFTTHTDPKWEEKLGNREYELSKAENPQDRERLNLLLRAERAHCGIDPDGKAEFASNRQRRQELGNLMEYDKEHGHPITDPSRDLQKNPYSPREQAEWLERDGRRKTTQETEASSAHGWNDHYERHAPKIENKDPEWYVSNNLKDDFHEALNKTHTPTQQQQDQSVKKEAHLERQITY